ncbi:hypothetical protein Droror1_Dr00003730 [Drosera rotundifolia]
MAFRAAGKSLLMRMGANQSTVRPFGTTSEAARATTRSWVMKADMAPIYIVFGMVTVAVMIAVHTAKQQLVHSPSVHLSKKKRGSISEVDEPSDAIESADKFVSKSFLRKIGHIQDESKQTLPNINRRNIFTSPRHGETLESIGAAK